MGKFLKTGLLILTGFIVFTGAGLYLFRHPLLETLLSDQLSKQGLPLQSISGLDVSFNTFHLNGLTAGKNKELRVDSLRVAWHLQDLLAGKPVSVEISDLQVALDLSKARPSLDSMQPMTAVSGKDISIPWLPDFSLKDSIIHVHLAAGDVTVALSGSIARNRPETQTIHLNTIVSGALAQAKGLLAVTLDTQGNIQGKVTVSDGILDLPEAKISSFTGEAMFAFAALRLQHVQTALALSGIKLPEKESAIPVSGQAGEKPAARASNTLSIDRITLHGDIRGLAQSWTGTLDLEIDGGQLSAESVKIQQLSVSLPMQVTSGQDNWRIGLRNPGQITFGRIDSGTAVHFQNPPKFSIPQADLEWAKSPQGLALTHAIAIMPEKLNLLVERTESPAIEAQIDPGKITLTGKLDPGKNYQGRLTIGNAAFSLPQSHVQLQDISATLHLNDAKIGTGADFAIGRLQHAAPEPLFATLAISGNIRNEAVDGKPAVYALNVTGGIPHLRYLKITGKHTPDSGNGLLKAEIVPLSFAPEGLQPGALSPLLAQLEAVSGHLSASAQLKWSSAGIRNSRAAVELRDISFARENTKLSDLNVKLNLADLLSPSSPPQQSITLRRLDAGIPLENLLVSYHIQSADPPRIAIEKAQFSILNGLVSVVPTIIDPAAARSDTLIRISNIDMEAFFNLINVDGLTGTGHFDGQIPLTLENKQVTIRNGHLAAKMPGVLRFKSEKASQLLASSGKEMNLLLQAMQDFHYTELSLDLDKSVTHDLVAKLSLLGNNPEVKDGQAFRLNIRLETDIDKILQTINQGYNLSHEILRGSLRLY
jgi:hypothetical protein